MAIHRVPDIHCIKCGHKLNHVGDELVPPSTGDWTICLYCKHPMVFTTDLSLRDLTSSEMEEAARDPAFKEAMEFVDHYGKMTGKGTRH